MNNSQTPTRQSGIPGQATEGYQRPQQQAVQTPLIETPKKFFHILDKRMMVPILVIILLLLAAIIIYSFIKMAGEEESPAVQPQTSVSSPEEETPCQKAVRNGEYASEDECFRGFAEQTFNPDYCYGIQDEKKRSACFSTMAIFRRDSAPCSDIEKVEGNDSASECVFNLAMKSKEVDFCFEIAPIDGQFSKSHCLFELAQKLKNPLVCDYLADEGTYTTEICKATIG